MEVVSPSFCQAVLDALDSKSVVLGTIVKRNTPFTDMLKSLANVLVVEVSEDNRSMLPQQVASWVEGFVAAQHGT